MRVYPSAAGAREFDVELAREAIDASVTLRGSREAGKSYGGFSARFAPRESTVLRADGETLQKDEDLTPHRWAELEGVYAGRKATFRITSDAANQWCLRNYGFTLQPGKPLKRKLQVRAAGQK